MGSKCEGKNCIISHILLPFLLSSFALRTRFAKHHSTFCTLPFSNLETFTSRRYQNSLSSWQLNINSWDLSALLKDSSMNVCRRVFVSLMHECMNRKTNIIFACSHMNSLLLFFLSFCHVSGHDRGRRQSLQDCPQD